MVLDQNQCCSSGKFKFEVELKTDSYPEETSWTLEDDNENVIYNASNYTQDLTVHNHHLCLPVGCYNFSIYDSYGDGIKEEVVDDDTFYYNPYDDDFYYDHDNGHYKGIIYGQQRVLLGGTFFFRATHNFCGIDVCAGSAPTPSPTTLMTPWLVGETSVSQTGDNYFDASLNITNTIGRKVKQPVTVTLFDKNCQKESTMNASQAVRVINVIQDPSFFYFVGIDQSLIGVDAVQGGTYATCIQKGVNSPCSTGKIEFCTRVSTYERSTEVAFRETNFILDFDLTENNFNMNNIGITDNDPDSLVTDVDNDFVVETCQCDSTFSCVDPVLISQDSHLVMCIKPVHKVDLSLANNVEITNFNIKIFAGELEYNPVWFSANSYEYDTLTDVNENANTNILKISTPVTAQFFIQKKTKVQIAGNAFLQFKSTKASKLTFAGFMMEVGLLQVNENGCLKHLITKIHALFA